MTPPDYHRLFDELPGLYMILNTDLTIRTVNKAYARATMIDQAGVAGRPLFEVFPDNPDDPTADGVRNLRASLIRVLETGLPGVFVAGDTRAGSVKRVASSVGEGSITVAMVHQYLSKVR